MNERLAVSRRSLLRATVSIGAMTLSGCGGGGAESTQSAPAPQTPAPAPVPVAPTSLKLSELPPWQWYEIPNTALSSVEPTPRPPGITGPQSKISAWCGATLKRAGSIYLLGAAGGHGDYAGNEVNALLLGADIPRWVQLRAPSATQDMVNDAQFYLDYRPAATHTYYATQFINSLNRMVVFSSPGMAYGGLPASPAAWPFNGENGWSFSFNLTTNDWDRPDHSAYPILQTPARGDFTACLCVKHPVTEDVYYSRNYGNGIWKWSAASNVWSRINENGKSPWYTAAAIDGSRDQMLCVGGYGSAPPEVRRLSNGEAVRASFGGLGPSAITLGDYPGVIFDEVNDCYLVFRNSNPIEIYRVQASTLHIDQPVITGTKPAQRPNGVLNAVQYVPELRGVVIANSYRGNVFFMRTAG